MTCIGKLGQHVCVEICEHEPTRIDVARLFTTGTIDEKVYQRQICKDKVVFFGLPSMNVVGFSKGQLVTGLFSWKHDVCYVWVWAGMGQKPLALVKKHSCLKWILVWVKIGAPIIRWLTLKIGKSLYCGTVPQVLKFDSPYGDGSIPIVTMRKFVHPAGPAIVWYYDTVHSMTRLTTHAVFSETGRPVQHDGHRNRRRLAAGYVPERDLEVGAGKDLHW